MPIHVHRSDTWSLHNDIQEARAECEDALKYARSEAAWDGTWPEDTTEIAAYEGPADAEDPSKLPCILIATAINITRPSSALDEDGYDSEGEHWESEDSFQCDYKMLPPK